ncbi:hypothetical protein ACWGA9_43165 [Streptomyces sp. NPDC054950]
MSETTNATTTARRRRFTAAPTVVAILATALTACGDATVTATSETFTVQETLVLVVVGKTLVVLSEACSPTAPGRSRTLSLARTAATRVP